MAAKAASGVCEVCCSGARLLCALLFMLSVRLPAFDMGQPASISRARGFHNYKGPGDA